MKRIIKTLLVVMTLALVLVAFAGCEQQACQHTGGTATCTEKAVCELCGESYGSALGHKDVFTGGLDATCTEGGYTVGQSCSVCGQVLVPVTEIPAQGHKMVEMEGKDPTCSTVGYTSYNQCEVCEAIEGLEEIPTLAHTMKEVAGLDATCTEDGYTAHTECEVCGATEGKEEIYTIGHNFVYGVCACGAKDPEYVDYYLIGWINGADYGCQGDSANFGEYKFVDGKLTAQFTGDCYIFVKSGNLNGENVNWYLTETYVTGKEATLSVNKVEKMWIPGGVEVVFTLTVNEDGTLTLVADYHIHNFSAATCTEPKTCECGETEGEALGHNFADATCTEPKTCACGATDGEALGHTLVDGVCSVCGKDPSAAPLANAVLDCSNKENRVSFSTEQQVWSQNGITLTLNRGEGTDYSDKAPLEFGSKGSLTIEGVGIKTIVIATGNTTYGTWVSNCFSGQPGVESASAKSGTVTIVLTEAVDVFTIEYLAKQGKIKTITINP